MPELVLRIGRFSIERSFCYNVDTNKTRNLLHNMILQSFIVSNFRVLKLS